MSNRFWRSRNSNLQLLILAGDAELKGTIDRINRLPDGTYEVIDYKTGSVEALKRRAGTMVVQGEMAHYLL